MTYKDYTNQLERNGQIKRCPVDIKQISNLLRRSYIDLKTARRNLEDDQECAYTYAYNAMLRCGLALMQSEGFRPDIKNKHLTIVEFASSLLGDDFRQLTNDYDFMRRKRNKLIYEPEIPPSMKEAKDAIKTSKEFVDKVSAILRSKLPQMEINLSQ